MYNCDVSNYNEVQSVFNKIDCEIGNIYGLINNAGINPSRNSITKTSIGDWNKTIAVNLSGAFHCTQFALKSMEKGENGGVIIMISSIAGINTMEKRASYSASKAGLIGLMRSVAADYSDKNIRCFCICPGYIGTDLTKPYLDKLNSEDYINLLEKHKLGRIGVPSDIANMSLFLLSEYSNWMTGLVLPVDGGYSV